MVALEEMRAQELREYCYTLRLQGFDPRQIAAMASTEFGRRVSLNAVGRMLKIVYDETMEAVGDARDQMRQLVSERLDAAARLAVGGMAERYERVTEDGVHQIVPRPFGDRVQAAHLLLSVERDRAKLFGLNAPERAEVTVTHTDPQSDEFQKLVAEFEAAASNSPPTKESSTP